MHRGRALIGYSLMLAAVLWLASCGDSEDSAPRSTAENPIGNGAAEQTASSPKDAEPLKVTMSAEVTMRSDRRLKVTGSSNLPDSAQLLIAIERAASGARWQERARVQNGQFRAGPLGFGSGVPDGDYSVRVQLSEAGVQPAAVRRRIGDEGERLAGELVREAPHGLGQIAVYRRAFSIGSELRHSEKDEGVRYLEGASQDASQNAPQD
ncbi:hypothetical protein P1P91_11295 [Halomonas piscis]|uniref:Uncharacterized protein n=1 Tax=Halomonas piscis TaxID=3031727 RepID=A0ABY9YZE1_9GAMM|nr:hypothetical protein [Halomonas piscis]WNK19429.1 hypothetical protein P1P91_11295 [Halomonas piscis]